MTTILLVDDHDVARAGIKALLGKDPKIKIIGEARSGLEALRLTQALDPQLVLLDMYMPGIDGVETARKMLLFNSSLKILIVSIEKRTLYPVRLLEIGAMGYLSKEELPNELFKAIYTVLKGHIYLSPAIAQEIALQGIEVWPYSPLEVLTLRELQVALLLIQGKTIKEITELLYVSEKTIMGYRHGLFRKLKIRNEVELILLIKKLGLLDDGVHF